MKLMKVAEPAASAPPVTWLDPRVRRTRQMLWDALEHLLQTRPLEEISIADITAAATLNRATFYDHYTDKQALLNGLVEARFQQLLDKRAVVFDGSCSYAIHHIILATCDYLVALPGIDCPTRREITQRFESAMVSVVRNMLLSGLRRQPLNPALSPELAAATLSGAIYGGAREWVRTPGRQPIEVAVDSIFNLVHPMLTASTPAASATR